MVGTDEADDSDLDDQLIKTDYKNTDDNESDNNSGRKEEISENEEDEDEEKAQRCVSFASENRTLTDEIVVSFACAITTLGMLSIVLFFQPVASE